MTVLKGDLEIIMAFMGIRMRLMENRNSLAREELDALQTKLKERYGNAEAQNNNRQTAELR